MIVPITFMKYFLLSLLVTAWCVLHSAMISKPVTEYLQRRLGTTFRFYRLFYNLVSLITLVPVFLFVSSVRIEPIFRWDGPLRIIRILLLGTAALLFFLGVSRYDGSRLLGIKQIREKALEKELSDAGEMTGYSYHLLLRPNRPFDNLRPQNDRSKYPPA
jgi:methanethiol S-methyltransferase